MRRKVTGIVAVLALVGLGGWNDSGAAVAAHALKTTVEQSGTTETDETKEEESTEERPVKEIKMTAENWKWTPKLVRVTQGTMVRLIVTNYDSPHRFDMKSMGLKVPLREGKKTTIEFVADKPGKHKWRCSRPCGNGCAKMTGQLIVDAIEDDESGN